MLTEAQHLAANGIYDRMLLWLCERIGNQNYDLDHSIVALKYTLTYTLKPLSQHIYSLCARFTDTRSMLHAICAIPTQNMNMAGFR